MGNNAPVLFYNFHNSRLHTTNKPRTKGIKKNLTLEKTEVNPMWCDANFVLCKLSLLVWFHQRTVINNMHQSDEALGCLIEKNGILFLNEGG